MLKRALITFLLIIVGVTPLFAQDNSSSSEEELRKFLDQAFEEGNVPDPKPDDLVGKNLREYLFFKLLEGLQSSNKDWKRKLDYKKELRTIYICSIIHFILLLLSIGMYIQFISKQLRTK